ncbi:uncharacterized protein LOC111264763 [Varroa jacobsoni]|uniref:Chitin-binding type-4 domain-containing protein n=1 Tax=Varroa destructor TaxID=109461 RepID=A0A7M7JKE1_VARDE|nr:uncharacterized protein LOC111246909 [Varroa destructor]XP_022653022.1 uncharacterized protein LOC111246909 [Varroa destructor]XP_022696619.1 uncharacterized protein LOC111264763 [Varroa jacobsoni]XP_022696620.1 uncharacterized protein LOC111264763 [Varroa jacobsoni]
MAFRAVLAAAVVVEALGHGRILEPAGRSSAWRFGFNTPKNYNDNELFCGGFDRQYGANNGKCGICGDPWDDSPPRDNEDGGKYGTGTIVRKYLQGEEIEIVIEVTTHHKGWFEFKLCPVEDGKESTQECLDHYPIMLVGNQTSRYTLPEGSKEGIYNFKGQLPKDLVCDRCVLQWHWTTGNRWGLCLNGTGHLGCGFQETFRGCSDITIA